MAIAGGTVPAFFLQFSNGKLSKIGQHNVAGHFALEPAAAIRALRATGSCYLKKYADNWDVVRQHFASTSLAAEASLAIPADPPEADR